MLAELLADSRIPPERITIVPGNHDAYTDGDAFADAMKIMRHTNAKLTMVDYTDAEQISAEPLPELPAPAPSATAAGA